MPQPKTSRKSFLALSASVMGVPLGFAPKDRDQTARFQRRETKGRRCGDTNNKKSLHPFSDSFVFLSGAIAQLNVKLNGKNQA